jgi:hypothetical protein
MENPNIFFAYFTPETLLPVTSIIATGVGIVMMVGRGSVRFVVRNARRLRARAKPIAGVSAPHFSVPDQAVARAGRH